MRFKVGAAIAAAAMGLLTSVSASAATYTFTLNGPYAAVWTVNSNPTPNEVGPDSFYLKNISGNYSQIPGNTGSVNFLADIEFYTTAVSGGFYLYNFYDKKDLLTTNGDALFTGTTAAPIFKTGNFVLTDADDTSDDPTRFSLTISSVTAAVPEPATWAFMIVGFGVVGGTMRTRKVVKPKALTA